MPLLTSIVDLDSIQSVDASIFNPKNHQTAIEALAHTIVELDGLVAIPVVRSLGIDDYELMSEHLSYFAYLKACELAPNLPDRLTVFIANKKTDVAISRQLKSLQLIQEVSAKPSKTTGESQESTLQLGNLESRIDRGFTLTNTVIEQIKEDLLQAIDAKLPQPIPPLDSFNRITEPEIAHHVQRRLEFLGTKKAQKIVAKLQTVKRDKKSSRFRNFADVLAALDKGQLSQGKMLEVIDRWQE
jgi:hypothetical protein